MSKNKKIENTRVCLACGKVHNFQMCPLIQKKTINYFDQPKRSYLMGNILLKCIREEVDVLQILNEIAELCEELEEMHNGRIENAFPMGLVTEYFASSLNCAESDFFIDPYETSKEYAKLLDLEFSSDVSVFRDENDKIDEIELYMKIPQYIDVNVKNNSKFASLMEYSFILRKTFMGEKYRYGLYLKLPMTIFTRHTLPHLIKKFPSGKTYYWATLNETSTTEILLIEEDSGNLQQLFEKEFDNVWDEDEALLFYPFENEKFSIWMRKIEKITNLEQIEWKHRGLNSYFGRYEKNEFELHYNSNENQKQDLCIRLNDGTGICFSYSEKQEESVYIDRLKTLSHLIEQQIIRRNKRLEEVNYEIKIKDFLVRQNIFKCANNGHHIKNITAKVSVIDNNGKKKIEIIPAGYCPQCRIYFIMESTYQKMKRFGHILCRITDEKTYYKSCFVNGTKLAQESILMQYGYNVSQIDGLTDKERQKVLAILVDNKVLSKSEIISYLDFFISQRNGRSNMRLAISKWEADREFVEHYRIGEYTQYGVNAIYRK